MRLVFSVGVLAITLAGCGGGGGGQVPIPGLAEPTASSGYAEATSSLFEPSVTITRSGEAQHIMQGGALVDQKSIELMVSATGNIVNGQREFLVTYGGTPVILQWLADNSGWFVGSNGDLEIRAAPWIVTGDEQASLAWWNINDHGTEYFWGLQVGGFNTDPDIVADRSDVFPVTFNGEGGVSVNAQDDSFWASAGGPATLIVDFNTGTISGSIELGHENNSGPLMISDTTLTIASMPITYNTFSGTASIVPADFGLSGIGTISVDGMFFGSTANAVGGEISGVGEAAPEYGSVTTYLNGAFLAEE
ncbi:transferrin-binding protein-like solute binding protein [Boseongicola aestuarii]|uniref:Transferrin-binding protein B C-lobe/N-lobe beta-barrel domain-containing protein n=1 Tax=Boseongicola aestuarii TaxID=1470561 RepID=A0A238J5B4_9RHOB|nr:transferrin-binding protein-like solute binding protein [Boseongicola aestuarii]SMX25846.1 hypothetical protein BOA8489_03991 [Boseongicola aestuarii]